MARVFDGTNDNLLSANNAIAGVDTAAISGGYWTTRPATAVGQQLAMCTMIADGAGNARRIWYQGAPGATGWRVRFTAVWSGTDGSWRSTTDLALDTRYHIATTYDRSGAAPGNDAVIYVDGVSVTVSEAVTPTGTADTGDDTIKFGENAGGTEDLPATLQHCAIQGGVIWSAADVNRAMWWGRPHGGLHVYHPFVTDKLADEGSAAETLTATGTTVASFVTPVVRPGSALMGMGCGW
jgi:hypothetical protein